MCMILMLTCILWKTLKQRKNKDRSSDEHKLQTGEVGEIQACSAIIRGEVEGVDEEDLSRLLKKRRRVALPESFYLNSTKDCSVISKTGGF